MKAIYDFLLISIITFSLIFGLLWFATSRPEVIFSWETKKCVKVINSDGSAGDCNKLPEKYDLIWGK